MKIRNPNAAKRKIARLKKLHGKHAARMNDIELEIRRIEKRLAELKLNDL